MANADIFEKGGAPHDDFRTRISGAVSRRRAANAMRGRTVYPAASTSNRKDRSRQLHGVNPDAKPGISRRYLARDQIGARRGLQLSHRRLEARDVPAAAGDGDGTAAAA